MSTLIGNTTLVPGRSTRLLLIKWIVALLVPAAVFTLIWGEAIVNNVVLGLVVPGSTQYDIASLLQVAIFIFLFYGAITALTGYLVAADSGRRGMVDLWVEIAVFTLLPIILLSIVGNLFITLAICAVIWFAFIYVRTRIRKSRSSEAVQPLGTVVVEPDSRATLLGRAIQGGFWFATAFALFWLILDIVFFFVGQLPTFLLIWVAVRTIALPIVGYFLGRLGGTVAVRRAIGLDKNGNGDKKANNGNTQSSIRSQLNVLSTTRVQEEAKDLVPNDLPLQSRGAQRFYIILLFAFLLFYPVIDPFLFGYGTIGRLASYGDAGRYIILALGLNIVVGFAGLLDLGYVAFFAIGAYVWGMVGSRQFTVLTNIAVNPQWWPWLFWPMLLVTALIAALWGVVLGAPTLRLRGDYLAIVTLGFGEIVPVVFLNMDRYTNGTNGLTGVYSPAFFGIKWTVSTPVPYYYLILALIAFVLFANVRLRDSRLGRAWVAIREDEIAAASSGVNLVRTKLFAFGAGAFFSGIAGAYYSAKLSGVSPENFSFSDSVIYLAMVVIGGLGSIPGVIVGALVVYAVNVLILSQLDTLAGDPTSIIYPINTQIVHLFPNFTFNNIRNLVFGVILITIMIFRPEGLIPSTRRRRELHQKQSDPDAVETSSLDAPPGSPGFESEIRVD